MRGFADLDPGAWAGALDAIRSEVGRAPALEAAAAHVTRELFTRFADSIVLARVYAVVPYKHLPPDVTTFVDDLAHAREPSAQLQAETPVLALLGTHGEKEAWCDRRRSAAHRGIPLLSASFVSGIPMVARLLKELGVELAWLDEAPDVNARRLIGGFNGVFYVGDAASARDAQGRLIIPAQDFVEEHQLQTVFGMGGFYPDGTLLAIIVFSREHITRSQVERLTSLISLFKGETFGVVRARRFFT